MERKASIIHYNWKILLIYLTFFLVVVVRLCTMDASESIIPGIEKLSTEALWIIVAILLLAFSAYIGRRVYKVWLEGRKLEAVIILVVNFALMAVILLW
ncbi:MULTISPECIES: hypothetical protein [Bacteroidaceae]|uniref:Uncharacterized protein n=1 Tax=Caecibacteroides pullorum TaxID=2725562 RepID=A0AA40ZV78_9BACT|nr:MULTISPECIES: hypothetical protein [Bacteroidaceae]MBM6858374.1 hypothetical protein [Caecibacteroides pullorum]MBV8059380.1 hypothetical protein [Caecibacteroides pullorum]